MQNAVRVLGVLLIIVGAILTVLLFSGNEAAGVIGIISVLIGILMARAGKGGTAGSGDVKADDIPEEIRVPVPSEEYDTEQEVTSTSSGNQYGVNLHQLTCTCPDFKKRRRYERGDLRRHCKHINGLLANTKMTAEMPELVRAVVENGYNLGHAMHLMYIDDDEEGLHQPVFAGFQNDKEWLNIFTWKRGSQKIERFGFNVAEKRWSHGESPQNSKLIKNYILHGSTEAPAKKASRPRADRAPKTVDGEESMGPSEKVARILRSRTEMSDEEINALSDAEGWKIVYSLPKKERDNRTQVLFTGFSPAERDELEAKAADRDLKVVQTVTARLGMLVCGENAGPVKMRKAEAQGVLLLSEDQFTEFLRTGEIP